MAVTVSQLFPPTQLTGSVATIYTAPSNAMAVASSRVRFTNTDTVIRLVTAHAIQLGGTASAANQFMNAEAVAPNTHYDVDVPVLAGGGFIQAKADSANVITMFSLSGIVFS